MKNFIQRKSDPIEMTFQVDDATLTKMAETFGHVNVPDCPWFDVQDRQGNKARYYRETVGQQWVPVTERLPRNKDYKPCMENMDGAVWYFTDRGRLGLGYYYNSTKEWSTIYDTNPPGEVIAWMPLPEPYSEED